MPRVSSQEGNRKKEKERGEVIQKITLPNKKQLLIIDNRAYQRFPNELWEDIDKKILDYTPVPKESVVEIKANFLPPL